MRYVGEFMVFDLCGWIGGYGAVDGGGYGGWVHDWIDGSLDDEHGATDGFAADGGDGLVLLERGVVSPVVFQDIVCWKVEGDGVATFERNVCFETLLSLRREDLVGVEIGIIRHQLGRGVEKQDGEDGLCCG